MKLAIMQPYFLPYIGYWQLINCVDEFVIYDNIEFTKKGWFNRNRILENGHDKLFTIPVKKDSDYLQVSQRFLSDDAQTEINRTLRIINSNYRKAPYFANAYPIIEKCFLSPDKNLFDYILNSVKEVCKFLDIGTELVVSSDVEIDHSLKSQDKVIAICQAENTQTYVNAIGGKDLYDPAEFESNSIRLKFIKTDEFTYKQFGNTFVPGLSIVDIMMFNSKDEIREMLGRYTLV